VKLSLIALPLADETLASHIADSLMNVIKGGKEFAAVANELNPQSRGGDVGWVTESMLSSAGEDFIKKCFGAAKGDLLRLKMNNVISLVKIEDKTAPVSKVKVATIQMSVPVSDKTLLNIDTELNQFIAGIAKDTDFEKAAAEKGYNLVSDQTVVPQELNLNQIKGSRQIISWAFNDETGAVKKFDLPDQRVIAKIKEQIEAGYKPLADVSQPLKEELLKGKKAEKIIADLKAKNLTSLDAYALALDTRVDTVRFVNFGTVGISGLGREPVLNVSSKYGEVNKLQGPVQGNLGVLVYTVVNRQESQSGSDLSFAKSMIDRTYAYRVNPSVLFSTLKEKLNVEDNRVRFF
jgi:peptidyl-prolyl cis-trans isomerase D